MHIIIASHESGSGSGGGGSFDNGDPFTTNLYVGNINPTVTETGLCHVFGKYGPIASVKIMWPRTQEEKDKGRNCGFVSFMQRGDADQAIRHLDGKEIEGFAMRVGWGKAVPLPAQPFFVQSKVTTTAKTGLPFNAHITTLSTGVVSNHRIRIESCIDKAIHNRMLDQELRSM
jgi:U2-associated protein SR140